MSRKRTHDESKIICMCKWCGRASQNPVGCPLGYTADCMWLMGFCTWECADAYSLMGGNTYYTHRHALIEAAASRQVNPAPRWELLLVQGEKRMYNDFIDQVRTTLSVEDRELAIQQDQQSFGHQSGEDISVKRAHVTFIPSTPEHTLVRHESGSAHVWSHVD